VLDIVRERTEARAKALAKAAEADQLWREGIRDAFADGVPGPKIAEAASLKRARVYQIRNGTR
jgi:hypothetical protein